MPSLAQPRSFAIISGSPFTLPGRGRPARSPALLLPGVLLGLLVLALAAGSCPARADTVTHTLRWASSPRKGPTGQPLPPAVTYEVWVSEDGKPETLAASVADTCWTFPAAAGCVYVARVRGVSAQGLKSAFSPASDPWRAALAPVAALDEAAVLGPARPNPFNAGTTITYLVPAGDSAAGTPSLGVFDLRGHRVRTLAADAAPGPHEAFWNGLDGGGRRVAAGTYLVRYACGSTQATLRVALVP